MTSPFDPFLSPPPAIIHNTTTIIHTTNTTLTTTTVLPDFTSMSTAYDHDDDDNINNNNNNNSSGASGNETSYLPGALPPDVAIRVLARFHLIAVPAIVFLGILGNLLSFCIFVSKTLRRTSCSLYLAARCLSDTGFLLSVFITWLGDAMGIPVIHTVVVCQVVVFASYVFGFLSVWLVVCITLENYIRICHPFSVCRHCTVQKARRVLAGLGLLSLVFYHFPLWTTHVVSLGGRRYCSNKGRFLRVFQALVYADMIVTLALPSAVIVFLMAAISVSLVRSFKRQSRLKGSRAPARNEHHRHTTNANPTPMATTTTTTTTQINPDQRQEHQAQTTTPTSDQHADHDPAQNQTNGIPETPHPSALSANTAKKKREKEEKEEKEKKKKASLPRPLLNTAKRTSASSQRRRSAHGSAQAKVTRLLFAVSFTFLVLSLPSHIVRLRMVMLMMVEQRSSLSPSLEEMLQVVFQILYYLSFAVNMLVYLSCGESFRHVFIDTYVSCFVGRRFRRRRSELSRTSYSMVKTECAETAERAQRETALVK